MKEKLKALLLRLVRADFHKEVPELRLKDAQLEGDHLALLRRLQAIELSLRAIHVGGVVDPGGDSWVAIGYKVGDRPFVSFYDCSRMNMGALREFLDRFERGGMAVLVKSPFNRGPKRKGGD